MELSSELMSRLAQSKEGLCASCFSIERECSFYLERKEKKKKNMAAKFQFSHEGPWSCKYTQAVMNDFHVAQKRTRASHGWESV